MRAVAVALIGIVAVVAGGCGGGDDKATQPSAREDPGEGRGAETGAEGAREPETSGEAEGEEEGEEGEQKGLSAIPSSDRSAFVQIATATGVLSTGASVLLVNGLERPKDRVALQKLRPQIASLHPRDRRLRRLRGQLLHALERAIRARRDPHLDREDAKPMLADANRLYKGLSLYEGERPAITALAPD
jgi:hypothetical protein